MPSLHQSSDYEDNSCSGFSVLIVDQDDLVLDLVCRTVTSMGNSALPVATISQAKSECKIKLPDLIILDLAVYGETGAELCKWVKQRDGGQAIPILILTEISEVNSKAAAIQYKVAALEDGADDFITKPFTFQELKARLGSLLRNRALNLDLIEKNRLLGEAQQKIIQQERQLCASQLAGAAAHKLGQPLTAMKLNYHLLITLPVTDPRHATALKALNDNMDQLNKIIAGLQKVDAAKTDNYHSGVKILELDEES